MNITIAKNCTIDTADVEREGATIAYIANIAGETLSFVSTGTNAVEIWYNVDEIDGYVVGEVSILEMMMGLPQSQSRVVTNRVSENMSMTRFDLMAVPAMTIQAEGLVAVLTGHEIVEIMDNMMPRK